MTSSDLFVILGCLSTRRMDLNIVIHADKKRDSKECILKKIRTAAKLGYEVIALSVHIGASEIDKIPEAPVIDTARNEDGKKKLLPKILTRLTVAVNDSLQTHKLTQSPLVKSYDLLAIEPENEKMLNAICGGNFVCDIVSFRMAERLLVNLKKANLAVPRNRGSCFEINYDEALHNQTNCQNVITSGQLLVEKLKGKNILLSSGAKNAIALRSCHDVANLGLLFSLKENQAKAAVFKAGFSALKHAETRRNVNSTAVTVCETVASEDIWLAKQFNLKKNSESYDEPASKRSKLSDISL